MVKKKTVATKRSRLAKAASKVAVQTREKAIPANPSASAKAKSKSNTKIKPVAKATSQKDSIKPNLVRVRMYRQGLGDCFLLSLVGKRGRVFHILIDCGIILGTPTPEPIMKQVVQNIVDTTGGHLNVLVATHEHWDHISGFNQEKALFDSISVDRVWLAWTENPADPIAKKLRQDRAKKVAALWMGVQHLQSLAGLRGLPAEIDSASQVLGFFNVDPSEACPLPDDGFGARFEATIAAAGGKTGLAMDWVKQKVKQPEYWTPGDTIDLIDEAGTRVFVLGPPTDLSFMKKTLPSKKGHETYEDGSRNEKPSSDANGFMAAALGASIPIVRDSFNESSNPFDSRYRIPATDAVNLQFFRDHYYQSGDGTDDWRRIDGVGMTGVSEFALQLDSETNNTSLALAFELLDGRVLLFPGDAQVGNWESWHVDGEKTRRWKVNDGDQTRQVTAEQLLNKTVLYKVGHHGSHNATLKEQGLEMMTDPSLVAMVPVDTYIAHDKKKWGQMPFGPLMDRIDAKTHHCMVRADSATVPKTFQTSPTTKNIDVDGPGGKQIQRPLYVDYFIAPN